MYVPRFRKIDNIIKEIKEIDSNTDLSWIMIKELINDNKINKMKIGNAWLVNKDELFSIFCKENKNENSNNN